MEDKVTKVVTWDWEVVTWDEIRKKISKWVETVLNDSLNDPKHYLPDVVLGVDRGGVPPAIILYNELCYSNVGDSIEYRTVSPFVTDVMEEFSGRRVILVDDISDTGATIDFLKKDAKKHNVDLLHVFTLVKRKEGDRATWYVFPWETAKDTIGGREQAAVAILRSIGEDPLREGLSKTPYRVAKMYDELCMGYGQDPKEVLSTTFNANSYDEMIISKDIRFFSLCEHHILPFYGKVHFGYIPDKRIVGVSKIARLVDVFARRLQIQERMTMQIGQTFEKTIKPKGVGVIVEGVHLCEMMRGVRKENAPMITSYLGGTFRDNETRSEFLRLVKFGWQGGEI